MGRSQKPERSLKTCLADRQKLKFLGVRKSEALMKFTICETVNRMCGHSRRGLRLRGYYGLSLTFFRTVRVLLYKFVYRQVPAVRSGLVSYLLWFSVSNLLSALFSKVLLPVLC